MQNHILFSSVYLGEQNWKFIDRESCLLNLFIKQRLSAINKDRLVNNKGLLIVPKGVLITSKDLLFLGKED